MAAEKNKPIGKVIHVFDKILVAVVKLTAAMKIGDTVKFKHGESEFIQKIQSMEIEHKPVTIAKKGEEVAIKLDQLVKGKTEVFKAE
ncbi:MAG: hypothetical protein AAB580_01095 [Patescibacteria group bacterium]